MAVIVPTFANVVGVGGGVDAIIVTWATMLNGDTGQAVQLPDRIDRSIQFEGTFGAGGSGTLQGSNDSTTGANGNFRALTNPAGTTIAITSAGIQQVTEATSWIRPAVTAGDGSTSLTATVCCRRTIR